MIEQQLQIEKEANQFSYDRLAREISERVRNDKADELTEGKTIIISSVEAVSKKIVELFNIPLKGKNKPIKEMLIAEFGDNPRELAYVILTTIVRSISKENQIVASKLIKLLAGAVHHTILIQRLEKKYQNLNAYLSRKYSHRSKKYRETLKIQLIKKQNELIDVDLNHYSTFLGAILLDCVIKSGIDIIRTKVIHQSKNKKSTMIEYTPECFRMVLQTRERLLTDYRKFPILVAPPLDWKGFDGSGGYYTTEVYKVPLIKARSGSARMLRDYFKKADNLKSVLEVVNTLQKTPWRVNKRVFEVMDYIFENNIVDPESPTKYPYLLGGLPLNMELEAEDFISPYSYGELWTEGKYKGLPKEKSKMIQYFNDIEYQNKFIIANNGKAIMTNLVLYNAKEYLDYDKIYFSYQYDFRSRIYPIQQHLQPQGDGKIKSLLEFANGVPITTDEELKWFLIHGANCYGFDKEEYDDRVTKIKELEEEIIKTATDPFKNQIFWKNADDPYLFLAWCFEYADYLDNPRDFVSHIPIALDATCSGIQIYSGLLLDEEGAKAVNVVGSKREDIYQKVADKVNEYLVKGEYPKELSYKTSDGSIHTVGIQHIVDSLKGKVNRKLTKRNTMTQPYSVTSYGMYEQLKEVLNEIEASNNKFWVGDNWLVAKLLTELNDRAIAETVKGARIGQEYLKEVTAVVSKMGQPIFYTTPIMNFPVLQKIHKTTFDRITTPIGSLSIKKNLVDINVQKMVSGIAPNFIHSLDATLLALTLLKLVRDGCKDFHMIHDSYGVPINHVANLNKRVREAYVELFKSEPLRRWLIQVYKEYPTQAEDIMINTLNLDDVLDSGYIFS